MTSGWDIGVTATVIQGTERGRTAKYEEQMYDSCLRQQEKLRVEGEDEAKKLITLHFWHGKDVSHPICLIIVS